MSKLRIALVTSPVSLEARYGTLATAGSTLPSFGLACLGAVAQRAGAEVRIIDAAAENLSVEATAVDLGAFAPGVVGISSTTVGIHAAGRLAALLKEARPETAVVVGGCHATALPEETLRAFPGFDMAVIGEGEATLEDLLGRLASPRLQASRAGGGGGLPDDVAGTAVRRGPDVRVNPRRALIEDLDELPLPAWSLLRGFPRAFRPSPGRMRRYPCATVVLTRGCPNRCVFCDRSVFGSRCRGYSPACAVRMIRRLREEHGVREVLVEDDTFVVSQARVDEFCRRLIAEEVDVSWSCLGRADRVTPELLRLMRRAGCWQIAYGIESGDAAILRAMRKKLEIEEIERAVRWSRQAGLRTRGFFMVGFPGESEESLAATRSLAKRLPLDDISVMPLTPFPGSELYARAAELGEFQRDWRRMNGVEAVFAPRGLTLRDVEEARVRLLREFYRRPEVLARKLLGAVLSPRAGWYAARAALALLRPAARRAMPTGRQAGG